MTDKKFKILVTEKVGETGLELLRQAPDAELEINMTLTHEQLLEKCPVYREIYGSQYGEEAAE